MISFNKSYVDIWLIPYIVLGAGFDAFPIIEGLNDVSTDAVLLYNRGNA